MFWSVLRPSSGVLPRTLRNYYVSTCLLRRIPVCGGMLSVCVYLRCTYRCGVWMCMSGCECNSMHGERIKTLNPCPANVENVVRF